MTVTDQWDSIRISIMTWDLNPRITEGNRVRLEPLSDELFDSLCECLLGEPEGWFSRMYNFNTPESVKNMIVGWTKANQERRAMSFVARDLDTMKIAGVSQFMRIDERNKQLEVGGTMIGLRFRRTHVNNEMKYLMLSDAFERLQAIRVYFKVDKENLESQRALLRIGAKYEGTARNDTILPNGEKEIFKSME